MSGEIDENAAASQNFYPISTASILKRSWIFEMYCVCGFWLHEFRETCVSSRTGFSE